jgi:hypothetical protein
VRDQLVKGNLLIGYRNHPQKDKVPLVGRIAFPNLSFSSRVHARMHQSCPI